MYTVLILKNTGLYKGRKVNENNHIHFTLYNTGLHPVIGAKKVSLVSKFAKKWEKSE